MVKPISPYLQRPLRSLDEALRDLERERAEAQAKAPSRPDQSAESAGKPSNPKDMVTIAGQPVAIEPGTPVASPTGGQLDVKA